MVVRARIALTRRMLLPEGASHGVGLMRLRCYLLCFLRVLHSLVMLDLLHELSLVRACCLTDLVVDLQCNPEFGLLYKLILPTTCRLESLYFDGPSFPA